MNRLKLCAVSIRVELRWAKVSWGEIKCYEVKCNGVHLSEVTRRGFGLMSQLVFINRPSGRPKSWTTDKNFNRTTPNRIRSFLFNSTQSNPIPFNSVRSDPIRFASIQIYLTRILDRPALWLHATVAYTCPTTRLTGAPGRLLIWTVKTLVSVGRLVGDNKRICVRNLASSLC